MSYLSTLSRPLSFNDLRSIAAPEELFALALAVEHEGVHRYDMLVNQMRQKGREDLAKVFAHLRDEEVGHEQSLQTLINRGGLGPLPLLSFRWDSLPEGLMPATVEALSPEQALHYALHNEQRTYALFLRIAANTHIAEVRHHAESLAAEELDHVARLARQMISTTPVVKPPHTTPQDLDSILTLAATEAQATAVRRMNLAQRLRRLGDPSSASLLQDLAEEAESRCRDLGQHGAPMAVVRFIAANDAQADAPLTSKEILHGEACLTFTTVQGFVRIATDLPPCGLSSLVNHEANLRLGAVARLNDRLASLSHCRQRGKMRFLSH